MGFQTIRQRHTALAEIEEIMPVTNRKQKFRSERNFCKVAYLFDIMMKERQDLVAESDWLKIHNRLGFEVKHLVNPYLLHKLRHVTNENHRALILIESFGDDGNVTEVDVVGWLVEN